MGTTIVTGAAGNLGRAVVRKLTDDGRHVTAVVSIRTAGTFTGHPHVDEFVADASDEVRSEAVVHAAAARHGSLDGFVGTVGGFSAGRIDDCGLDDLHGMMQLNFDTAFAFARPVVRLLAKQPAGGVLVFIGSRAALNPGESRQALAYALSKAMLVHLAESINALPHAKVRARVIVPGTIDTPQNRHSMPNADFSAWTRPEALAEMIGRLLSEADGDTVVKAFRDI